MMVSLPFHRRKEDSQIPAPDPEEAPECSLLVCGLPISMAVAHLGWEADTVPVKNWADGRLKTATVQVLERPLTVFRYFRPHNSHPATVPPRHLHDRLNLLNANSGFLFVHDPSNTNIEESIQCMSRYMELQELHGGRGFWVVINTPRGALTRTGHDSIAARFEDELRHHSERDDASEKSVDFGRGVLQLPVEDACRVVGEAMLTNPHIYRPRVSGDSIRPPGELSDQEFQAAFHHGRLVPWKHKDYIRAAYLTLLRRENSEKACSRWPPVLLPRLAASNSKALSSNYSQSRVFWLYQIKLAISAFRVYHDRVAGLISLKRVVHFFPELRDEKLPNTYYTSVMLKSPHAENFWMLPNLRDLVEPLIYEDPKFRERLTKKQHGDPKRLLRFAFAVVQRYLRPGETRRRSWFINIAFSSLQKYAMYLRSVEPLAAPFSETQSYFYVQLVHAALSQLVSAGKGELVQDMSYALFKDTFGISPSAWTAHYTPKLWDSLEARGRFVPPDLKPLPNCIDAGKFRFDSNLSSLELNEPFNKAGLIPELPSLEILHFHQTILFEDAKSINPSLPPDQKFIMFHNCPCHAGLPIPDDSAGSSRCLAVSYPRQYPYDHPPQLKHGCVCHAEEEVDQDGFAAVCAEQYRELEEVGKRGRGANPFAGSGEGGQGTEGGEGGQGQGRGGERMGIGERNNKGAAETRDWDGQTLAGGEEDVDEWEVVL
ncbi:hypothetical protein N658DRAFT_561312 [Parathielavia hyrcaniae]|uniref:Uncharacterized protein n=1 Tax=Parathielavia hyrcaniae TaxID=113614 RepID=A0AAN6SZ50_9PEZI|nr:hypothetical protein N658DRAFT_561312 [Parathielavia hyrcaniae]